MEEHQKQRILTRLQFLVEQKFRNYSKAEIRCYSAPVSVRGRKFGDVVNLSWYTPDLTQPNWEVRGHSNPIITASLGTKEGEYLDRMFSTLFDLLWNDGGTVDARKAYEEAMGRPLD